MADGEGAIKLCRHQGHKARESAKVRTGRGSECVRVKGPIRSSKVREDKAL